jgi:ATP-dependent RNA helicase DeaD
MEKVKFEDLKISEDIKRAIADIGFEEPSPIQEQAIPLVLEGKDIIGQAQTGTGKTAAFGIPALEMVDIEDNILQAMILCPTRELAIQATEELNKLAKYKKGISILAVYGGQPIDRQIKALKRGVHVIVGTPGRIMDHMNRKTLKTESVKMLVLDEADEMLDMGFREDIETIIQDMPDNKQTVLFSATMPKAILELSKKYQKNAQFVKVVHKQLTVPNIEQKYLEVKESSKLEVLSRLIDIRNPKLAIVFCNTKKRVDEVVSQLQSRGHFAEGLHGDMKQQQRDRVMSKFRNGTIEILVATDVAARGIDVDDVEVVFNYDLPQDEEYYVHRIGRTGRAGRTGIAYTFIAGKAVRKLRDIENYTKTKIKRAEVPSANDVEEFKTNIFLDKVKSAVDEGHLGKYIDYIEKLLEEDYATIDIAAALFKMATATVEDKREDVDTLEDIGDTGAESGMVRLFINVGRSQNIQPKDVIGAIAGETGIQGKLIGKIDIYDKFTFVEVPKENARDVLNIMKDNTIKGKRINIEPANSK